MDKVTCNSNGQWNGVTPSCKKATSTAQSRYYCGTPPEMPNAKHNGTKEQVSCFLSDIMRLKYSALYRRIVHPKLTNY